MLPVGKVAESSAERGRDVPGSLGCGFVTIAVEREIGDHEATVDAAAATTSPPADASAAA